MLHKVEWIFIIPDRLSILLPDIARKYRHILSKRESILWVSKMRFFNRWWCNVGIAENASEISVFTLTYTEKGDGVSICSVYSHPHSIPSRYFRLILKFFPTSMIIFKVRKMFTTCTTWFKCAMQSCDVNNTYLLITREYVLLYDKNHTILTHLAFEI
jgi:hypothetical protein